MRLGVFGDIHANLEALASMLSLFSAQKVDAVRCLGDVVGYGGSPAEVFEIIHEMERAGALRRVIGNNDEAIEKQKLLRFSPLAEITLARHRAILTPKQKRALCAANYRFDEEIDGVRLYYSHTSQIDPQKYPYIETRKDPERERLKRELAAIPDGAISCIAHTHIPKIYQSFVYIEEPEIFRGETCKNKMEFPIEVKNIVNAGSAGQPRNAKGKLEPSEKGDPRAHCVIIDTKQLTIEYHRFEYDVEEAIRKVYAMIINMTLPQELKDKTIYVMADRLRRGY